MASLTEENWNAAQQAEEELLAALAPKDLIPKDVGVNIARYRIQSDKVIMNDFQFAMEHDAEQALWIAHVRVHKRFQKVLRMYLRDKKPVEYRKTAKNYLDFIKDSQRYYRGFVQRLVSKYGGVPELDAVAANLRLETIPAESTVKVSESMRRAILLSCHRNLVYLGDLSRYREEGLAGKECNWGPAIGYYDLAGAIYPASGASHHQLAVVAQHGGSHLRATYHLYRALAVEEPDPRAQDNLELELRKIELAQSKGKLLAGGSNAEGQASGPVIVGLFMLLHSRLYKGTEIAGHDELENEALTQLAIGLKERSMEGVLNKLVLINIAAQYFAGVRFQNFPNANDDMQAFVSFLRFNVKTFITLLHVLQLELGQPMDEVSMSGATHKSGSGQSKVTAVTRRILPALRHYSSWLICSIEVLIGHISHSTLDNPIKVFFKMYAGTLTLLASTYNPESLPSIEYLLEEDEDSFAFKPFGQETRGRYFDESSNTLKQKCHTYGVERHHPNVEMLGRIRDLLTDGVVLATRDEVPIDLVGVTGFAYREEVVASEPVASPLRHQATISSTNIQRDIAPTNGTAHFDAMSFLEEHISRASSSSASVGEDTAMENMVDDLVGSAKMANGFDPKLMKDASSVPRPRLSTHGFTYSPPPAPLPDYGPIGSPPRNSGSRTDFGPIGTPPKATGDETSYGMIGTPTAQELARKLSPHSSMEASPRPRLPSIYNSPFAPQADEAAPLSRPGTAKPTTPNQSQRNSLQGLPLSMQGSQQGTQPNGYHVIESSVSSLQEPSSIGFSQKPMRGYVTHSPRNQPSVWNANRGGSTNRLSWGVDHAHNAGHWIAFDDSHFMSSNILSGSIWNGSHQVAMAQTPPNGQGRG